MNNSNFESWVKAASIRALRTMAQTAVATIATSISMNDVNWAMVGSISMLAGILSILTSIGGIPEVDKNEGGNQDE